MQGTAIRPAPQPSAPKTAPAPSWRSILASGQAPLDTPLFRAAAFLLILAECAGLYWVMHRFRIETDIFRMMMAVAFPAFAVHHFLPPRYRLPFFLALSMGLVAFCLGLDRGQWKPAASAVNAGLLFGVGLALIGICRLPLRFRYRAALLIGAGGLLAVFRANWLKAPALDAIWPVLGAMFMYRLAVYLYDLEHEKKRSSLLQGCSYFFLFPNIWLFVFPVIDFTTFLRTYYDQAAHRIYQRGVEFMMRGVIQLIIWRFVYYQMYIDPGRIASGAELAQFLLANVALYLRVSGQFHIAIGLLHLFGFHLPEANRKYFLASSFVDYWRRANIYMKDFLMKICYYPLIVRFKQLGPTRSLVAAIACTFVVTWFLHPYQWFWIRGTFQHGPKDAVFWTLLGVAVTINSVRDLRRTAGQQPGKWRSALSLAGSTGFTFAVITVLWSIWTCDSLEQWVGIWGHADRNTLLWAAGAVGAVVLVKLAFDSPVALVRERSKLAGRQAGTLQWRPAFYSVALPGLLLVGATTDTALRTLTPDQKAVVRSLFSNTPNKSGEEFMVRGYYEGLMDIGRVSPMLEGALTRQPTTWQLLEQTPAVRVTNDLRTRELVSSVNLVINQVPFRTNSMALRDSEYPAVKPAGATRIALMGSSITMGWNVRSEQTFEAIVERELNVEANRGRTEILNFAVNGYSIVSLVEQLDRQVISTRPDIVMVVSHPEDPGRAVFMLAKSVAMGAQPDYPYLRQLLAKENLSARTPRNLIERKLAPYGEELTRWAYRTIAETCRARGIRPVLVYLPGVLQTSLGDADRRLVAEAEAAGFTVVPLFDVYSDVEDRSTLMVAAWDAHPNAEGHRRVAAHLLAGLRQRGISNAAAVKE